MKNLKELKKLVDKIEADFKELQGKLNKEEEIILVPDNIKIEKFGPILCIDNQAQSLFYQDGIWSVIKMFKSELTQCKLIPCEREEIKKGDLFFRINIKNVDFKKLYLYAIALKDNADEHAYWDGPNVLVSESIFNFYYKVVAI